MIYLTGDTHGAFTRLSKRHMKSRGFHLTADDYMSSLSAEEAVAFGIVDEIKSVLC